MSKKNFSLDFENFLEYAERVDKMGEGLLKKATENALNKSKEYANNAILDAMERSPYSFDKGNKSKDGVGGIAKPSGGRNRRATGKAKKSVEQTADKPIEWKGNTATAYIGGNLKEAPEILILALGTPHIKADKNLNNAIKVKGKHKKEVATIQQQEFIKVIKEAQHD